MKYTERRDGAAAWTRRVLAGLGLLLTVAFAQAEDIDIYTSAGAGSSGAPNIIFLIDNSANWARASQRWPDNSGNQGEAELLAIQNVLAGMTSTAAINIGVAMYNQSGSTYGGYIRFGARDMSVASNRTKLSNILGGIRGNINSPNEKVAQNSGEAPALYELYKYFRNSTVFRGGLASSPNLDIAGNAGASTPYTAVGQGLSTQHAVSGSTYYSPVSSATCGRSYVILIANNANGTYPAGAQSYEGVSAGSAITGTADSWTDEWARFLYQSGVSVYVLDAYNAQNNAAYSNVLKSAATNAAGKYFQVGNQAQIETAIKEILAEIQSVNSAFAAASLPISSTNRGESLNQVFIGMFRPDPNGAPRWNGNLKRFKAIKDGDAVVLGDAIDRRADSLQTGFINDCAASFWTTDSGTYWADVPTNPVPSSACVTFPTVAGITGNKWSDLPDGPTVEKGGVAEVLRKGNNPPSTNTSPTWASNRTIYTLASTASTSLTPFSTATSGLSSVMVNWVRGSEDASAALEKTSNTSANTRPSIHGDVVNSRPLPVDYGGVTGVTVYYGANDGMFRAVDANTGRERWAFLAPEAFPQLQRLHDNLPLINYPSVDPTLTPTPAPKDYFFDGSTALYQNADNTRVWVFTTMRRGGRMIYGFDVSNPESPSLKWRVGCPNLTNDTGCTSGFAGIGQTWSTPNIAFLKGHSTDTPMLIVGGGYSSCEDANSASPSCSGRKGSAVFVINADTGALVKSFSTEGSVPADVSLVDANGDGSVDHAYAVDTAGNIYRADFSSSAGVPAAAASWAMRKVAYTTGRKFLFRAAVARSGNKVYVAVGSGDRQHPLATHYPYTAPITNRFYVYLDDLTASASSGAAAIALDSDAGMRDYSTAPGCNVAGVTVESGLRGWYRGLDGGRGEQVVSSAAIFNGLVTFNTHRATPPAEASCTNSLGEARGYAVNLFNAGGAIGATSGNCGGSSSALFVGGGLVSSPFVSNVVIDGTAEAVLSGGINISGAPTSAVNLQRLSSTSNLKRSRRIIYWKSNLAND